MSGNGGNPHSLRDLLGTYEKSGLGLLGTPKGIEKVRNLIGRLEHGIVS